MPHLVSAIVAIFVVGVVLCLVLHLAANPSSAPSIRPQSPSGDIIAMTIIRRKRFFVPFYCLLTTRREPEGSYTTNATHCDSDGIVCGVKDLNIEMMTRAHIYEQASTSLEDAFLIHISALALLSGAAMKEILQIYAPFIPEGFQIPP